MNTKLIATVIKTKSLDELEDLLIKIEESVTALLVDSLVLPVTPVKPVIPNPVIPVEPDEDELPYETKFHHTTTGSSDGGKSLVMCPGQKMNFDHCECNGITIPFHGYDEGRETYWEMFKVPKGDIICVKDGKKYRYKANRVKVDGKCR